MKKILLLAIAFILFTGCSYVPKSIKNIVGSDDNCDKNKMQYNGNNGNNGNYNNLNGYNNPVTMTNQSKLNSNMVLSKNTPELKENSTMRVNVVGQGVAPINTSSPAQAYALAKRAAIADAYRLLAEKIKGVHVEGQDFIENMMVKRSSVRTSVAAMIKNANATETTFKEGLCEVEMEVTISHSQFAL